MSAWSNLQRKLRQTHAELTAGQIRGRILHIETDRQRLTGFFPGSENNPTYQVSTSRHGLGEQRDSHQTPRGLHCIAHKIGDGEPPGRVFKARQPTEQLCLPADYRGQGDVITSRILWLQGVEAGVNSGGAVDSRERYIYIHGTPDVAQLGHPASIGCVRMRDEDVIQLFDLVEVGDLVYIE